ncbi:MAG: Calx-beta domain-containing protein [Labilithrix sp.]
MLRSRSVWLGAVLVVASAACGDAGDAGEIPDPPGPAGASPGAGAGAAAARTPGNSSSSGSSDAPEAGGAPSEDGGTVDALDAAIDAEPFDAAASSDASSDAAPANDGGAPELVTISVAGGGALEGADGPTLLTFTITLSAPATRLVSVTYATADGTATALEGALFGADYVASRGRLAFEPGEVAKAVNIAVHGDRWREGDETLFLELAEPSNGIIAERRAEGTIRDDDADPTITIDDALVVEGDSGSALASFVVTLSAPTAAEVTVRYLTTDETASSGSDFTGATGGVVTFAPGQTSRTIEIAAIGDTAVEGDETFAVVLTSASGATLARSRATGRIQDDDRALLPRLVATPQAFTERSSGRWSASIPVTLDATASSTITVDYETRIGTATTMDFEPVRGTLTFAPGERSKTIDVGILGDAIDEEDESFVLRLANPSGALLTTADVVVTVLDDDAAPTIGVADVSTLEDAALGGVLAFAVSLSAPSEREISVAFGTADGTAVSGGSAEGGGGDYLATTGTLVFPPGQTTQPILVAIRADLLDEPDESFILELTSPVHATLGPKARATGTIANDDRPPQLRAKPVVVYEGSGGAAVAALQVELVAPVGELVPRASGRTVEVDYTTLDGTATAPSDYAATSGTLRLAPGETTKTIAIDVVSDSSVEGDEAFEVAFSKAIGVSVPDPLVKVTLIDDDGPRTSVSITDQQIYEGDDGRTDLVFYLHLSKAMTDDVSVDVATGDDVLPGGVHAQAGSDYIARSERLVIPAGMVEGRFRVSIVGDVRYEGRFETFKVNLSNPSPNATIGQASAFGAIIEDDPAPVIGIFDASENEGDPPAGASGPARRPMSFLVGLDRKADTRIVVNFATEPSSATPIDVSFSGGQDYVQTTGSITFEPGEIVKVASVDVFADRTEEPTESFLVKLSSPSAGARLGVSIATLTLVNDDSSVLSVAPAQVTEGATGLQFLDFDITLTNPRSSSLRLDVATLDGTATWLDGDYLPIDTQLTFAPGETHKQVRVPVVGDRRVETNESMLLLVRSPRIVAAGTILNDD